MFLSPATQPSRLKPSITTKILDRLNRIEFGELTVVLPDNSERRYHGMAPGPSARIKVNSKRLFSRLVFRGEIGFAEAYLDQDWDTGDLQAVLDLILVNSKSIRGALPETNIVGTLERIQHWLRSNSKRQARKNISYHYDLGNAFYGLWLDDSMTYSSGLFEAEHMSLSSAQACKYEAIAEGIGANENKHVLEIGCGWGGFAEHVAKTRGAKVTGLTISKEQYDFAKKRVFEAGLADKVEILLRDYRDEPRKFDGIASIEMFEAVGEKHWPTYFETLRERLKPAAKASIQTITVADDRFDAYRNKVDFIQKYIFPGGMLPSPQVFSQQAELAGLCVTGKLAFGQSYSKTLRLWSDQFNASWPAIQIMGFDDRFCRMWNYYLAACAASFRYETIDVMQFTVAAK